MFLGHDTPAEKPEGQQQASAAACGFPIVLGSSRAQAVTDPLPAGISNLKDDVPVSYKSCLPIFECVVWAFVLEQF